MRRTYLDYAATTPVDDRVADVFDTTLRGVFGNPSSLYAEGRAAREALESAREDVAQSIGAAHPDEVVFCGSGTESDNAAVLGIATGAAASGRGRHVVVSSFEHHAVLEAAARLERGGFEVTLVACDATGIVEPEAVAAALRPDTALVSVMHANNEIGTVQPLAALAAAAHAVGAYFHADAAQTLGKLDVDVRTLGLDAASFAGHKIYAPKGTGALYVRTGVPIDALLVGGGQEFGRRSGTQSVAGAAAFATALRLMDEERVSQTPRLRAQRDAIERAALAIDPAAVVHGARAERLAHLTNIGFSRLDGQLLMLHLDEAGFAVSTGSACSSGSTQASHVLRALKAPEEAIRGSVRITVGRYTTEADVERFVGALAEIVPRLQSR